MDTKETGRRLAAATMVALAVVTPAMAMAQDGGAVIPLPPALQAQAERYLPGVVGPAVPGFTIDPSLAHLAAETRTYQIIGANQAGTIESHVIAPLPRDTSGQRWRYQVGNRVVFLSEVPGQSLSVVSENDEDQGVTTRYQPPEPMLIAGMNPGDQQSFSIDVSVYDLSSPGGQPDHTGTLNLTLTYVGAYQVTVPAGTFNAALLEWRYKGKIGPASVEDNQARFVAPGIGMVASAEKRDIAAFLVYNDNSKVGRVLVQQP
ncbi:MAG: hypothetical protein U1E42_08820 [Rhodospirillales bacterium]